jgi:hypothetical protein
MEVHKQEAQARSDKLQALLEKGEAKAEMDKRDAQARCDKLQALLEKGEAKAEMDNWKPKQRWTNGTRRRDAINWKWK